MKQYIKKLKQRWGIEHAWELAVILLIFSLSGITALWVRKETFAWLGFNRQTPLWEEAVAWVAFVVPSYQAVFLLYGFLLGQFDFVWRFQKKNLRRIKEQFQKWFNGF